MRKLFFLLFLTLTIHTEAQQLKIDSNTKSEGINLPYCMTDSIINSNLTKDQIYSNVLSYIIASKNYNYGVIELKDLDLGEILFNGHIVKLVNIKNIDKKGHLENEVHNVTLFFKCRIYCKNQKFKIVLSSLETYWPDIYSLSGNIRASDLHFPVQLHGSKEKYTDVASRELATSLIKEVASKINSKPQSEF